MILSRPIPRHLDFLSLKESQQKCTMITLEQAHSKWGLFRRRSKVRQSVFFLKLLLEKGSLSFERIGSSFCLEWDITELEQNALGELMQHFSRPTLSVRSIALTRIQESATQKKEIYWKVMTSLLLLYPILLTQEAFKNGKATRTQSKKKTWRAFEKREGPDEWTEIGTLI